MAFVNVSGQSLAPISRLMARVWGSDTNAKEPFVRATFKHLNKDEMMIYIAYKPSLCNGYYKSMMMMMYVNGIAFSSPFRRRRWL